MTESPIPVPASGSLAQAPVFPPGRYGRRRDPRYQRRQRLLLWALGVVVMGVALAAAIKMYGQYAAPPYEVRIISVSDLRDDSVTVTFEVATPAGQGAACTVLAHSRDGRQVGRAEVLVPPAQSRSGAARLTYTLATTGRPVTGEVPGCGPIR